MRVRSLFALALDAAAARDDQPNDPVLPSECRAAVDLWRRIAPEIYCVSLALLKAFAEYVLVGPTDLLELVQDTHVYWYIAYAGLTPDRLSAHTLARECTKEYLITFNVYMRLAAYWGHGETLAWLAGRVPDALRTSGLYALTMAAACSGGHFDLAKQLAEQNCLTDDAVVEKIIYHEIYVAGDRMRISIQRFYTYVMALTDALHAAASIGDIDFVRWLLSRYTYEQEELAICEKAVSSAIESVVTHTTALDMACIGGHVEVVLALVDLYDDRSRWKGAQLATQMGHVQVLKCLRWQTTPGRPKILLTIACRHAHYDVVSYLIDLLRADTSGAGYWGYRYVVERNRVIEATLHYDDYVVEAARATWYLKDSSIMRRLVDAYGADRLGLSDLQIKLALLD